MFDGALSCSRLVDSKQRKHAERWQRMISENFMYIHGDCLHSLERATRQLLATHPVNSIIKSTERSPRTGHRCHTFREYSRASDSEHSVKPLRSSRAYSSTFAVGQTVRQYPRSVPSVRPCNRRLHLHLHLRLCYCSCQLDVDLSDLIWFLIVILIFSSLTWFLIVMLIFWI